MSNDRWIVFCDVFNPIMFLRLDEMYPSQHTWVESYDRATIFLRYEDAQKHTTGKNEGCQVDLHPGDRYG